MKVTAMKKKPKGYIIKKRERTKQLETNKELNMKIIKKTGVMTIDFFNKISDFYK